MSAGRGSEWKKSGKRGNDRRPDWNTRGEALWRILDLGRAGIEAGHLGSSVTGMKAVL